MYGKGDWAVRDVIRADENGLGVIWPWNDDTPARLHLYSRIRQSPQQSVKIIYFQYGQLKQRRQEVDQVIKLRKNPEINKEPFRLEECLARATEPTLFRRESIPWENFPPL